MQTDDDAISIGPAAVADYATAVFSALFVLLEKKGVVSMREVGEALIGDADESPPDREVATTAYLRVLGAALVQLSDKPHQPDE